MDLLIAAFVKTCSSRSVRAGMVRPPVFNDTMILLRPGTTAAKDSSSAAGGFSGIHSNVRWLDGCSIGRSADSAAAGARQKIGSVGRDRERLRGEFAKLPRGWKFVHRDQSRIAQVEDTPLDHTGPISIYRSFDTAK